MLYICDVTTVQAISGSLMSFGAMFVPPQLLALIQPVCQNIGCAAVPTSCALLQLSSYVGKSH